MVMILYDAPFNFYLFLLLRQNNNNITNEAVIVRIGLLALLIGDLLPSNALHGSGFCSLPHKRRGRIGGDRQTCANKCLYCRSSVTIATARTQILPKFFLKFSFFQRTTSEATTQHNTKTTSCIDLVLPLFTW